MAVTFTTTYVGKDASGLLGKMIANTPSFAQGGFTINENVKGFGNIRLVDGSADLWVDDDGTFADGGTLALTSKKVTLAFKKLNKTILKKDIATDWASADMAAGAAGNLSGQTAEAIKAECLRVAQDATEAAIWTSLITAVNADATVVDQAVSTFTSANVVAQLSLITEKYADSTNGVGEAVLYMHPSVQAMLNTAQSGLGNNDARGFKAENFGGYKIVSSIAIPKAKVLLTPVQNMHFLIDRYSDLSQFAMLDQSGVTGANAINLVVNASYAAAYVRGSEIVLGTAS